MESTVCLFPEKVGFQLNNATAYRPWPTWWSSEHLRHVNSRLLLERVCRLRSAMRQAAFVRVPLASFAAGSCADRLHVGKRKRLRTLPSGPSATPSPSTSTLCWHSGAMQRETQSLQAIASPSAKGLHCAYSAGTMRVTSSAFFGQPRHLLDRPTRPGLVRVLDRVNQSLIIS